MGKKTKLYEIGAAQRPLSAAEMVLVIKDRGNLSLEDMTKDAQKLVYFFGNLPHYTVVEFLKLMNSTN